MQAMILSFIMQALNWWMQKWAKDKKMIQAYHEFLGQVDQAGAARVANLMASDDALAKKQAEIRARLNANKPKTEVREDGFKWEKK